MSGQHLTARIVRRHWLLFGIALLLGWSSVVSAELASVEQVTDFGDNPGALSLYYQAPSAPNAPVVVVMHGCGQQAGEFARQSGWRSLATELGFGLVLPQQEAANNQKLCFNWYREGDVRRLGGELASIKSMIDYAVARQQAARVYVAGLSAGGAMAAAMLATYPERFEVGAVVAGVAYRCGIGLLNAFGCMQQGSELDAKALAALVTPTKHQPAGGWPRLSIWHGQADAVVNVANAHALKRQWLGLMQRVPDADSQQRHGRWARQQWLNKGQISLELNLVDKMNHGQSIDVRQEGEAAPFVLDHGISTAREIARFFGLTSERRG